jgi:opacity protein-like surface antigen
MIGILALSAAAHAQSATPAAASKGYVEVVAQSAFGNVTSQSFGVETGVTVAPRLQVFVEAGQTRDTSPASLGANAQLIAGFLSQTQSGVAFTVKQPVTFGVAGVRYGAPVGKVEPYVLGGVGVAQVKRDVAFSVGGSDVTSNLQNLGVALGTDLSGSETKAMISLGGGIAWPAWQRLVIDLQYRYGRILTSDEGLNLNRAGVGIGVRF